MKDLMRLILHYYPEILSVLLGSFCIQELQAAVAKCAPELYYDPVVKRCENCWSICDFAALQGTDSECQVNCPGYIKDSGGKLRKTGQGGLEEKATPTTFIVLAVLVSAAVATMLIVGFLKRHMLINKLCRTNQNLPAIRYEIEARDEEGNEGIQIIPHPVAGDIRAEDEIRAPLATAEDSILDATGPISGIVHTQPAAGGSSDPVVPGHIVHNEMYNVDSTFAARPADGRHNQEHPVVDPAGVNRDINKHAVSP